MAKARLNAKQRIFVREYLRDKNASRAYRAAGYPGKGADQSASRLLRNAEVAEAIEKGLARLETKLDVSAERVVQELAKLGFHTTRIKHGDKLRALELLGKHFGAFTEKIEVAKENKPRVVFYLPKNGSEVNRDKGTA